LSDPSSVGSIAIGVVASALHWKCRHLRWWWGAAHPSGEWGQRANNDKQWKSTAGRAGDDDDGPLRAVVSSGDGGCPIPPWGVGLPCGWNLGKVIQLLLFSADFSPCLVTSSSLCCLKKPLYQPVVTLPFSNPFVPSLLLRWNSINF
jgi:hypothetical protein